jgi:hypothetical protein
MMHDQQNVKFINMLFVRSFALTSENEFQTSLNENILFVCPSACNKLS